MLARTRGVDGLVGLIGRCKRQARRAAVSAGGEDEERTNKWKERGEGVGKVLQSVLVNAGVRLSCSFPSNLALSRNQALTKLFSPP
jgi:hypothetical protein